MKPMSSFTPAYYRLAEDIKNKIESGELRPGDIIPSEVQLAKKHQVSRMTIRQGISLLVKEGFIKSIQGKGSFITAPPMDTLMLKFSDNKLLGENKNAKVDLLSVNVIPADKTISYKLNVVLGTKVLKLIQLLSDPDPVAIDTRFLPYLKGVPILENELKYAAFPDLVSQFTQLISVQNTLEISASVLSDEEAKLLEAMTGQPALCIEQIICAADDVPMGWSKMICRNDRFTIKAISQTI
ncbi:MAG: hypothetical protein APF76_12140 [Desulfitibacter sp. BRH_c19]|nr:MAG: hypothetical protein APF76_12140 [Desulfitibacter sp. BRH_c19]